VCKETKKTRKNLPVKRNYILFKRIQCCFGHCVTLLSPITPEFFSADGHLYQKSMIDKRDDPQDFSLSLRTEERISLVVNSSSSEKFLSLIFSLHFFFFKLKESFVSLFSLFPIWKWTSPALGCQATPVNSSVNEATIWSDHPLERATVKDHGPVRSLDVMVSIPSIERKKVDIYLQELAILFHFKRHVCYLPAERSV